MHELTCNEAVSLMCVGGAHLRSSTACLPSAISSLRMFSSVALACMASGQCLAQGKVLIRHVQALSRTSSGTSRRMHSLKLSWRRIGVASQEAYLVSSESVQEVVHIAGDQSHILYRAGVCAGSLHQRVDEVQEAEQQLLVQLAQLRPEVCTGTVRNLRSACFALYANLSRRSNYLRSRKHNSRPSYSLCSSVIRSALA